MVILVLSESMNQSLRMCSKFEEQQHICAPIQDIQNLMEILEKNRESKIDLLVCDYFVFSSNTFNPYEAMRNLLMGKRIPFIFYNDPLLPAIEKSTYWENSIINYYTDSVSIDLSRKYRPFFIWLSINCSMKKFLVDENEEKEKSLMKNEDELLSAAKEIGITDSRLVLLLFFWKNQGNVLYSDEICRSVWNKSDDSTMQKLYTYISNLRKAFLNCIKYNMQIIRSGKNRYIFRAEKRKLIDDSFSVNDFMSLPIEYKIDFD